MEVTIEQALATIGTVMPGSKVISGPVKSEGIQEMSSTEAPYSLSFKTNRGTLVTVRGESHAELATNLSMLLVAVGTDDGPMSVMDIIADIEKAMGGSQAPQGGGGAPAPAQAQVSLTPACETCGGETTEKTGVNRQGRAWKGYFCKVNKDHPVKWG